MKKYPVLVIDFNAISLNSPDIFNQSLMNYLIEKGKCFGIDISGLTPKERKIFLNIKNNSHLISKTLKSTGLLSVFSNQQ